MKSIIALCCLFLAALSLSAHDTWLQADASSTNPGDEITLQLTSGHGFKGPESGPRPDRVERAILRIGDQTQPLATVEHTPKFLAFTARLPTAPTAPTTGAALFAVELKPRDLELKPDSVADYLDEIHAGPELRAAWENMPAPRRWRERYTKTATTFVRIGPPSPDDRAWSRAAGLALEIVPQNDPAALRVGDVFKVQLLKDGQALAGLPLGFVADGETSHQVVVTDADGFAAAALGQPGRWLVRGTDLVRATAPDLEWESRFSTLVVEVAPAR